MMLCSQNIKLKKYFSSHFCTKINYTKNLQKFFTLKNSAKSLLKNKQIFMQGQKRDLSIDFAVFIKNNFLISNFAGDICHVY